MGDVSDMYKDIREVNKLEKRERTQAAPEKLRESGLVFEVKNGGSHVIVSTRDGKIDFWPGNELWIIRGTKKRQYGIDELIEFSGWSNQEKEMKCHQ